VECLLIDKTRRPRTNEIGRNPDGSTELAEFQDTSGCQTARRRFKAKGFLRRTRYGEDEGGKFRCRRVHTKVQHLTLALGLRFRRDTAIRVCCEADKTGQEGLSRRDEKGGAGGRRRSSTVFRERMVGGSVVF
jgi:hypothetical protein